VIPYRLGQSSTVAVEMEECLRASETTADIVHVSALTKMAGKRVNV
jgi:hypothetical protein